MVWTWTSLTVAEDQLVVQCSRRKDQVKGITTPRGEQVSASARSTVGQLVLGLPWATGTRNGWGEGAVAVAPAMTPSFLVDSGALQTR